MSVIRQDPTTKEWVVIATERAQRPHDFVRSVGLREVPPHVKSCPFCVGNEAMTPDEILREEGRQKNDWRVRVVPNKYSVLRPVGEPVRKEEGLLFREMSGVGAHEVIIETPVHNRIIPLMEDEEVEQILIAYQKRYWSLREDPRVRYLIIFKNHGEGAGTSLEHPHSQLVATPIAPMLIRRKYEVAIGHFDDTGRCVYCDLVDEEQRAGVRIIEETDAFVVFHPYASRLSFETWIAPKSHQPSFGQAPRGELSDLARVLKRTLVTLREALGDPDYNYILHTAPVEDEEKPYFLWHLQILPRLSTLAGFELGSGISITTVSPEESAVFIREVGEKNSEGIRLRGKRP
jgi:UDPglucose--hexose-1-phosphate uridylyltransferase